MVPNHGGPNFIHHNPPTPVDTLLGVGVYERAGEVSNSAPVGFKMQPPPSSPDP